VDSLPACPQGKALQPQTHLLGMSIRAWSSAVTRVGSQQHVAPWVSYAGSRTGCNEGGTVPKSTCACLATSGSPVRAWEAEHGGGGQQEGGQHKGGGWVCPRGGLASFNNGKQGGPLPMRACNRNMPSPCTRTMTSRFLKHSRMTRRLVDAASVPASVAASIAASADERCCSRQPRRPVWKHTI